MKTGEKTFSTSMPKRFFSHANLNRKQAKIPQSKNQFKTEKPNIAKIKFCLL